MAVACLGMLAVVAVPRQRGVTAETRRTEVAALAAGIDSAARLAHSLWRAHGGGTALDVRRGRVTMVHGYPAAGDVTLLLEEPETMGFVEDNRGLWRHGGVSSGRRCGVRYTPPPQPSGHPSVEVEIDDC